MVTESILHFLNILSNGILNLIPSSLTISIPDEIFGFLNGIFSSIGYFIPVPKLLPLIIFIVGFTSFRFTFNIFKKFIPFL